MTGDSYVGVTVTLVKRRPKAILVSPAADPSESVWIPRSCIHGADDSALNAIAEGGEITLRMFEWIANEKGL